MPGRQLRRLLYLFDLGSFPASATSPARGILYPIGLGSFLISGTSSLCFPLEGEVPGPAR